MSYVRVWAEARGDGRVLLTWEWQPDESETAPERDTAADERAVVATLGVRPGVVSAQVSEAGVEVAYDPDVVTRAQLAAALRAALAQEDDLKTRANAVVRRAPAYFNLARALALDERVSPVPNAARAASQARPSPLRSTPLRVIPGFPLLRQLPTLIPVMRSLASWSREAPPGVVNEHLEGAGLTREQLDRDLATAHEALAFAKDYSSEVAGKVAKKAGSFVTRARDNAKEAARQFNEQRREPPEPDA